MRIRSGSWRAAAAALLAVALAGAAPGVAAAQSQAPVATAAGEWRLCLYLGGHPTLLKGSTGEAVRHLQCILSEVYRYLNVSVNGVFDEVTEASVKHVQQQFSLPVTGIVDAATWQALHP
ncbi:peptidoglycan-binding domain-containing protein [Streptomyces sp. NPDC052020]|uniref:peptidoglycan-binding domain-containing protein n=1 Tax=Streptomyces sp. NPDC052020 TaxID=3155677 RepID=UPI00342C3472